MNSPTSPSQPVDREAWLEARKALLDAEKAFTRERDELSRRRRELPWLEVDTPYSFEGPEGTVTLAELFGDSSQLLVYHFMMGPDWDEGCPSCSFWADNYDGLEVHLRARDTALAVVARAPSSDIEDYKARMGWSFPWVSSLDSDFNFDLGVSFTPEQLADGAPNYNFDTQFYGGEEAPGVSVFAKDDSGRIFLTYQTFSRGLDMINAAYHMLDLTPKGRDEDDLPWTMAWLHRHDAYPPEQDL